MGGSNANAISSPHHIKKVFPGLGGLIVSNFWHFCQTVPAQLCRVLNIPWLSKVRDNCMPYLKCGYSVLRPCKACYPVTLLSTEFTLCLLIFDLDTIDTNRFCFKILFLNFKNVIVFKCFHCATTTFFFITKEHLTLTIGTSYLVKNNKFKNLVIGRLFLLM